MLVSGPLMEAGGQSVAEGWQDLQRRSSRLASIDGEGEMLVRGLRAEPHPRLATDGRHLAYLQVDGKHPAQVVVRDLVTGRVVAHRTVNGSADFAWVNESLVVSQLDYGSPVELRSDLYWWTPGGNVVPAVSGRATHPSVRRSRRPGGSRRDHERGYESCAPGYRRVAGCVVRGAPGGRLVSACGVP